MEAGENELRRGVCQCVEHGKHRESDVTNRSDQWIETCCIARWSTMKLRKGKKHTHKLKVDKNKNQFCSAKQIFHVLFITVSDPKYAFVQQATTVCLHSKHWNVENKLMSKHVPNPFRIVSGNICSTWNIHIFIDLLT